MQPRRKVFASGYISETIKAYQSIIENQNYHEFKDESQWFHDVLSKYFSITGSESRIDEARQIFQSLPVIQSNEQSYIPYKRETAEQSTINYDSLLSLSIQRRSVRWYIDKPVPRDVIDKAIKIAALSPSACNRQPFEFRIFDDPSLVQKVSSLPMGTKGFNHNFPVIVAIVGKLRAYFSERDRHIIYIDGSLAAMSFMYALETLGLSSCPINWPDIEHLESKMEKLLDLEPDERPIMLISLGYPDPNGMVAYSQKKSLDNIRRYN